MADEIKSDHFQKKLKNGVAEKFGKKPHEPNIKPPCSESPGWGVSSKKNEKLEELPNKKDSKGDGREI